MKDIKVERYFYPNGQASWEASFKDGKPIGVIKKWHDNGILSWECPLDDEGLEHGTIKQYNREGKLLGKYCMDHGTGFERSWFENGQLQRESSSIRGKLCGRFRCWLDDGEFVSDTYYIMEKKVSKKKYLEACKTDPTLPRYEDDNSKTEPAEAASKYKKRETPMPEQERHQHEAFIKKFLKQPNRGEARQWLAGDENRNIGEMTPEESREFVEEGYKAGATKILTVEIEGDTTNCLIVYLPPAGPKREKVFEWNSESAQKCGFDPYDDWGQNELFAYFS